MVPQGGDLYGLLGVTPTATEEEIRSAYRKIALECHPDRNPEDPVAEQRFKEVSEAYEILSDQRGRAEYDRLTAASSPPLEADSDQVEEVVDTVGIIIGSVMGAVRARREGRKVPSDACPGCQGEGQLVVDLAIISFTRVCPMCNGAKKLAPESPSLSPKQTT